MTFLSDPAVTNPVLSSLKIKSEDKIIFIRENSLADSNFIITHLFKQMLHQKSHICLLTLHNNFNHYQTIGKILGYDLREVERKGDLKIIDLMEEMVEHVNSEIDVSIIWN